MPKQSLSPFQAAIFGLILLIVGLSAYIYPAIDEKIRQFIITAGVAILLGSFGGAARVQYQGWTITGVAGIAFVFMYILRQDSLPVTYFEISSNHDMTGRDITVVSDRTYYGVQGETYKFLVAGGSQNQSKHTFDVYIDDYAFHNLPISIIKKHLGKGIETEWIFEIDELTRHAKLYELKADGSLLELRQPPTSIQTSSINTINFDFGLISKSFAYEGSNYSFEDYIQELESENASERRRARLELANFGLDRVNDLLEILQQPDVSYLSELGVIQALVTIGSDQKDKNALSSKFTDEDIEYVASLLQNSDPSIRRDSQTLLSTLQDPRAVDAALSTVAITNTPVVAEVAFNVFSDSFQQLPDETKAEFLTDLETIQEKDGLSDSLKNNISFYLEKPIVNLTGKYTGQWGSNKYSNYGNVDVDLQVNPDGTASAYFEASGGTIKWGKMEGTVKEIAPGVWEAQLAYQKLAHGTKIVARISGGQIQGDYDANFRVLFTDNGWWDLERIKEDGS